MPKLAIVFLVLLLGCTPSKHEVVHPDFNRLPPDSSIKYRIDMEDKSYDLLPEFFNPDNLEITSVIGQNSSVDDKYYFQVRPAKIDIDKNENIFIAQHHTNSINVYDKNGNFLYSIGGGGDGPGEFLKLITFTFDSTFQHLYALDYFDVEIFALTGKQFEYKSTIHHNFIQAYDLCYLNKNLYISGYKIAASDTNKYENETQRTVRAEIIPPITKFNVATKKAVESFGFKYSSYFGYGSYDGILSHMMLTCNEKSQTIVGIQKDFPYIFGYDTEGHLKWTSRTDGYIIPKHIEFKSPNYSNAGLMQYTNETIYNRKYPISTLDYGNFELLQFVNQPPQPPLAKSESDLEIKNLNFRTVLIDSRNGKLYYSDRYSRIAYMNNQLAITVKRDPNTFQRIIYINEY